MAAKKAPLKGIWCGTAASEGCLSPSADTSPPFRAPPRKGGGFSLSSPIFCTKFCPW